MKVDDWRDVKCQAWTMVLELLFYLVFIKIESITKNKSDRRHLRHTSQYKRWKDCWNKHTSTFREISTKSHKKMKKTRRRKWS